MAQTPPYSGASPALRLSMIVRNEERRYLKPVLESASAYITDAVIIDDGSTDNTAVLCRQLLQGLPHVVIENERSKFANEWELRAQQWEETIKNDPDWILFLDADEMLEDRFASGAGALLDGADCDLFAFRLYDFWDAEHYREDELWCAHTVYRPFLLRYKKDFTYEFTRTSQHCGRMPSNVFQLRNRLSEYRVKHYGWARAEDRLAKFRRYLELDPHGVYGSLRQYLSIMDAHPRLVKWVEQP